MTLSLKRLLIEIILEAAFGKKFKLWISKNGTRTAYVGLATANTKPGERPYRITWFSVGNYAHGLPDNRHVDLTVDEIQSILNTKEFPPEIIQRVRERYPNDTAELIGDHYTID